MSLLIFIKTCGWCGSTEERILTDSWTGVDLCLECIGRVANTTTNSPASEGDNLNEQLLFRAGDRRGSYGDADEEVFTLS